MYLFKKITLIQTLIFGLSYCTTEESKNIPDHLNDLEQLIVVQPNSEPAYSIEFIRSAEIHHSSATNKWFVDWSNDFWAFSGGDYWFAGLEVDDSGRIYVGNRAAHTIQVFDSDGLFLTETGGEGNGPGEFNGISDIKIQNNQLLAFDFLQFRTTFYSLDPLNVAEVKNAYLSRTPDIYELNGWLSSGFKFIDDERFLVRYVDEYANTNVGTPQYNLDKIRPGRYYIVDREGKVVSEMLFELISQTHITADVEGRHLWNWSTVPFLNQPLVSISDDGYIISANSEEFLIKMFAYNGDYIRAFYIPLEKKTLTRDELLNMYGDAGKATQHLLQNAELPEIWPALGNIILDDENRLWVSTIPESDNLIYEWWILLDTGDLLAKFRWTGNRSIEKIKNGYLYTRETEESTGIQTIVKYRIEMDQ
ncbi:MAG: 6-bladed beta-propeller [Balneolaceae bacterium]|nr:MAG: 6-bladed beta-propeller [Balneolaceae bacterium]